MTVGEKIKTLRKSMGLTQTELGQRVGVQKNAVSKWECGRVEDIPTSTIKALANLFGVSASYLIDDDTVISKAKEEVTHMEKGKYEDHVRQIIDLVDGMTDVQWSKIQTLINRCIAEKKAKVTFEKPEHLDLLMKQNFIS